jgi:hypothetical protein
MKVNSKSLNKVTKVSNSLKVARSYKSCRLKQKLLIKRKVAKKLPSNLWKPLGLGACPPPLPENFGFFEAQIGYFQHFEEFSNKKSTLH